MGKKDLKRPVSKITIAFRTNFFANSAVSQHCSTQDKRITQTLSTMNLKNYLRVKVLPQSELQEIHPIQQKLY